MGLVCKANKLMRRLLCIGWILPLARALDHKIECYPHVNPCNVHFTRHASHVKGEQRGRDL